MVKGFYLERNDITDVISFDRVHIREVVGSSPPRAHFPLLTAQDPNMQKQCSIELACI